MCIGRTKDMLQILSFNNSDPTEKNRPRYSFTSGIRQMDDNLMYIPRHLSQNYPLYNIVGKNFVNCKFEPTYQDLVSFNFNE